MDADGTVDVDALFLRLTDYSGGIDMTRTVQASELLQLITQAQLVFQSQPAFLELSPPVVVCGDIHGQYGDLLRYFNQLGYPPATNYLFLGDYVDRGPHNLETIALLFCFKIKYPRNFFLLRGNHETSTTNAVYGFRHEVLRRYNDLKIWQRFNVCFAYMPLAAMIGDRILCMHGGLSPYLRDRQQLKQLKRGMFDPQSNTVELDLLWSDPEPRIVGWQPSARGCSYLFGNDVIRESCARLDLDLIVRAHQVVQDGYEMNPTRQLITVFSAPNYCGEFDNSGAAMFVDQRLTCSFIQFRPTNPKRRRTG